MPDTPLLHHAITLESGGEALEGRVVTGHDDGASGVLFVHGWDSDQRHYVDLSGHVASLGYTCMTFDLRGHGESDTSSGEVSRADNLGDVLAAYDALARWPTVDPRSISIIGTSYGGYLATLATAHRPVRWLALRVPAPYPDAQWEAPKAQLDRRMLHAYRLGLRGWADDRALTACRGFRGDVLVVESALDKVVPHAGVQSFVDAFALANSIAHHCIAGADHELSEQVAQDAYRVLLTAWIQQLKPAPRPHPS